MWRLKWRLRSGSGDRAGFVKGLRDLRECRTELNVVRRAAMADGELLVEAYASPEFSGGQFVLTAPTMSKARA